MEQYYMTERDQCTERAHSSVIISKHSPFWYRLLRRLIYIAVGNKKQRRNERMLAMNARLKCQNSAVATRLFAFSNLDKSGSVRKAERICHNSCCISVI